MADHSRIPKNEKNQYCPRSKAELTELVKDESVSLGQIDTVHITDMSELFMAELDDDLKMFFWYHLEEKNFYTMIRNRFYRRWIKALDVNETRTEWERGDCGLSFIDRFFRDNEYLDDSSGVTIARNAKDETRWNAYLERIAPRVLRNVELNPWEDGYTGRFWPWREKLAWFHRQKQGMKVRCIGTKGQTRKKLYIWERYVVEKE